MKFLLVFMFLTLNLIAQNKNPDQIINDVKKNFEKVKDYTVDLKIKLDIDFIKAPDNEAKFYYKKPGKVFIESKQFALVPKEGLNFIPSEMFQDSYTALYQREDNVEGHPTAVVKVIPNSEKSDLLLSTLWIDRKLNIVRKVETSTKMNGTFTIFFKYDNSNSFHLPSSMVFVFNTGNMKLPKAMRGNEDAKEKSGTSKEGKVFVTYSNYQVNKGLNDSIFEKK